MILYEDTSWLAVAKPTGMPTHAPRPGVLGVVEWLRLHLGREVLVVSRLDAGTSGVLLLAKTAGAAARAQAVHTAGGAAKTYEFLAEGSGLPGRLICQDPLDGKEALTEFTRVGAGRWRARISHGRRHQVRRHAAAVGLPLLGDEEYGGQPWPRLALHCKEVSWPGLKVIHCEIPESFRGPVDPDWAIACERRGGWQRTVTDAWRAVHRDELPDLPAAIDVYGEWLDAVWYDEEVPAEEATARLAPVLEAVANHAGCRGGVIRGHVRNPHRRGLVSETHAWQEAPPSTFQVTEHGLHYGIDLLSTQHTGLFLDQRDTRRRVALAASGARMANLFSFTCSFAMTAVAGGAEVAFSVDTAKACLETGKANFALNGLSDGGRGKFIREDARKWLARQERRRDERPREHRDLDLVVCDPPVFAGGRGGSSFGVADEWPRLAESCAGLLRKGGVGVFANNHRGGNHKLYREQLAEHFAVVEDLRPPLDFPELPDAEMHVRTFWCRK